MEIVYKNIEDLKEYENNPRINNSAVEYVKKSIKQFGFKVPIVIDKDNTIICGHTRLKACRELDIYKIPCILADDLTEEQIRAFRLADNKSSELATWDSQKLEIELQKFEKSDELNIKQFGFLTNEEDFFENEHEQDKYEHQEDNDEYNNFVDKFKDKFTTDDCFTPENVYDEITKFVEKEYNVKKENFVRPFFPGGDYEKYNYKKDSIVVDNPPFSIYHEIVRFYVKNNIKFFLFGNGLTILSAKIKDITYIVNDLRIEYQNGVCVNTNFATNLEKGDILIRTSHELAENINKINKINSRKLKNGYKEYNYPENIIGVADIKSRGRNKEDIFINKNDCEFTDYLYDNDGNKIKQFGTKLIVSNNVIKQFENLKELPDVKEKKENNIINLKFNKEQLEILDKLNKKRGD